ncbi:MAG: fasciclin domain-containing protein [Flavobacteriales bacterium]
MKKLVYLFSLLVVATGLRAQTVVDIIVNSDDHNTLEAAVLAAGLEGTLSGDGPFTVFAPTDDAFNLLPAGTVNALLNDIPALTDILTYHVVSGNVQSGDLSNGLVPTLNGSNVIVNLTAGVMINNAMVTVANVTASNGVVHVIDAVLLPPPATVVDIVVNSPDHTILETAVLAAGLETVLSGSGPFTVFAPTDAAFNALPAGTVQALLNDIPTLTTILTYHAVGANALSTGLSSGFVTTLSNSDILVSVTPNGIFINNAQVIVADILADNGIVHVIDAVLLPPAATVVDIVVNSPVHTILEAAVLAAGLEGVLSGEGPFTVFAPTDAAFEALPAGTVDALLNDIPALTAILTYHVVGGAAFAASLSDGQTFETVLGDNITVSITADGVFINDAQVIATDLLAENGIVHVIDAVLLPPVTVMDIIIGSEDHTTLEAAIDAAGLTATLDGEGPFTVFAPTDAAFELLPEGTVEALLNDIPTLTAILTYHVVGATALSTDLSNGFVATLNGSNVLVNVSDAGVFINNAEVIFADIETDNGVVHVIDAVLLPPPATVVDIIVDSEVHTTLEAAVLAAGLETTLSGDGPFTVFAPTDAAFDLLPAGTVDALLNNIPALTAILTYHAVGGNVLSTDLENGFLTTLNGSNVLVNITSEGVFINNAQVIIDDLFADNGVVHVIDAVLLPPAPTVVDIIVVSGVHTTLEAAVIAADLVGVLSGDGPFTVFAPTDAAFEALPAGTVETLLEDPSGLLTDILLYHVAGVAALSTDLSNGQTIPTAFGENVTVTINADGVFINDAQVIVSDLFADNGVVHVIDAVLLPPAEPITVVDIIVNSEDHTILETAVIAAGLDDDLSAEGPFTVFAPTDAAFGLLPAGLIDELLADPTGALANILLYHVVSGAVLSTDLSNGGVPTLQGQEVQVDIDGPGVMINNAMVTVVDLVADNGVVHVINAVLLPPTSVEDMNPIADFNMYPNPANAAVNIAGDVPAGAEINIFDNAGRVVLATSYTGFATIDVSNLASGAYTIMVTAQGAIRVKQFIVE